MPETATKDLPAPILSDAQLEQITGLADSISPEQAIWISGYFAGLSRQAGLNLLGAAPGGVAQQPATNGAAPAGTATRVTTILFASETGNSKDLANSLAEAARGKGIETKVTDVADYKVRSLKDEQDLLVVAATHGEGDPPQTALDFFEFLEGRKAPKLPQLRFAVLALGDSTYEHYCSAGRRVDERLEQLGAERIAERVDCDVDYEEDAEAWIESIIGELAASQPDAGAPATNGAVAAPSANGFAAPAAFGKKNPFDAPIIENLVLTGRGSSKETRHIELSLEESGLTYKPGDALGVVPQNDPALVSTLLDQLALAADAEVTVKK
ncbi:MAG: flavodoxin domain-containing protein, partial [Actinomycetota bacterium]|nr:flavodoxin domain-containing protein [Actinomycetota bacterium]